jgi:hypothetical protein
MGDPMPHHVVTALVLLAALTCYFVGFSVRAVAFVVMGGALELWFWLRLFRHKAQRSAGSRAA